MDTKNIRCPNCGSKMIYYQSYYFSNIEFGLAYCPECKLGSKLIPGKVSSYSDLNPNQVIREIKDKFPISISDPDIIKQKRRIVFQCNECANDIVYYLASFYKGILYLIGYCNKCGNIELRDRTYFTLKYSFPYDKSTKPLSYYDFESLKLLNASVNKSEDIKGILDIVDQVILEDFCIKYCVGNRDEYCNEISCARNKIINKLKLKLKEHGKLE